MDTNAWINCEFTEEEYNRAYSLFLKGYLTEHEFTSYCMAALEKLLKREKNLLDRLKNN